MNRVYLGLGCNLGNRLSQLHEAVHALCFAPGAPLTGAEVSSVFESPALLPAGAPAQWDLPYLNLCVSGRTSLDPVELLAFTQRLERRLGRRPSERWAPRLMDIDVLDLESDSGERGKVAGGSPVIPHPEIPRRDFVLLPLIQVAPQWRHPGNTLSAAEMLSQLDQERRAVEWVLPRPSFFRTPLLMGILNITPDSFSDGGVHEGAASAALAARTMLEGGAAVLDLGAESTRPGSVPVSEEEEWRRLAPVFESLAEDPLCRNAPLSIDTRHGAVALRAVEHGARWINDVTGFEREPMMEAAARSDARLVCMHSLGIPPSRDRVLDPRRDVIGQLHHYFEERLEAFSRAGIARERIILDPGVGFGKTTAQSWEILARASELTVLGCPILIGHSRKSYLNPLTAVPFAQRDAETIGASVALLETGISYLRVHEVPAHARALAAAAEIAGICRSLNC